MQSEMFSKRILRNGKSETYYMELDTIVSGNCEKKIRKLFFPDLITRFVDMIRLKCYLKYI